MIDGAATWRLSIQPSIPKLPEVNATENSTSDLTDVKTSQGVVRVENPLSQLRRLLCFWLQFPWREVGWCNSRFWTGPKILGHSRDSNRPTPQLTVEEDAIPRTVSAEALPNSQEKALDLWNWLRSRHQERVFWGAFASPDPSPSARLKADSPQPLTHGALHEKITSLRIRAKLKQQQLRAYTTLSAAINPEILQLQVQKEFNNLLDQILGRWDELDETVQQEVKDLYHRLFKVERNLVPGLDSVDGKGGLDEEEYWRDVVLHEDNGLLRDELVELWLIENVFLDDEWGFKEKEQEEEEEQVRVRVEL